jgi:hypothetical protein
VVEKTLDKDLKKRLQETGFVDENLRGRRSNERAEALRRKEVRKAKRAHLPW